MADLGPGNDSLEVEGSLAEVGSVRFAGGLGNDTIKGGPEDDLIEAGFGADRLYGGAGSDGLIGGMPGPDLPIRRPRRRPARGRRRLRRRRASSAAPAATTPPSPRPRPPRGASSPFQAHAPGSTRSRAATGSTFRPPTRTWRAPSTNDILIGDARDNAMLGQPGEDRFYGGGGEDVIDARDEPGLLDPVRPRQCR